MKLQDQHAIKNSKVITDMTGTIIFNGLQNKQKDLTNEKNTRSNWIASNI